MSDMLVEHKEAVSEAAKRFMEALDHEHTDAPRV